MRQASTSLTQLLDYALDQQFASLDTRTISALQTFILADI